MKLLALFLLSSLVICGGGQTCISGGVYSSTFNNCYHFFTSQQTFLDASKVCDVIGGELVSIHSAFEQAFLSENARSHFALSDFWIGLADFDQPGTFAWIDDTPLGYTDWEKGYPTATADADCVASRLNNGYWYNTDCDERKYFICAVDPYLKSLNVGDKFCAGKGVFYNESQICLYYVDSAENYFGAKQSCESLDGVLLTLENKQKQSSIAKSARQKFDENYWIGLDRLEEDGQWEWSDIPNVNFTNWKTGYPLNDTTKLCAIAEQVSGSWKNVDCTVDEHPFVCETKPATTDPASIAGNWSYFAATNSWYMPFHAGRSWNQYEDYCISFGGHLASIHSLGENDFVFGLAMSVDECLGCWVFIGLKSTAGNIGTFEWTDGSRVDYTRWESGYPSGAYFCAGQYQWEWENHDCTDVSEWHVAVCKKSDV